MCLCHHVLANLWLYFVSIWVRGLCFAPLVRTLYAYVLCVSLCQRSVFAPMVRTLHAYVICVNLCQRSVFCSHGLCLCNLCQSVPEFCYANWSRSGSMFFKCGLQIDAIFVSIFLKLLSGEYHSNGLMINLHKFMSIFFKLLLGMQQDWFDD